MIMERNVQKDGRIIPRPASKKPCHYKNHLVTVTSLTTCRGSGWKAIARSLWLPREVSFRQPFLGFLVTKAARSPVIFGSLGQVLFSLIGDPSVMISHGIF